MTAIVFPGMGPSDFASVGRFMVLDPYVRRRLAEADEALGYDLLEAFYGSNDAYSEYTQVAFLVNSLALADRAVEEHGLRPEVCAAPSFGQRAASVFTGSLGFADGVRMTAELARCETEFFREHFSDVVTHTVVRIHRSTVDSLLDGLVGRGEFAEYSGFLDDDFFMVSMREPMLAEFTESVRAAGGYSLATIRPPVHARSFTGLRERAAREVLDRYPIETPRLPVIADATGAVVDSAEAMRAMLLDTFDRPIDWPSVVATLRRLEVERIVFTGPDALFRRLDRTKRNFTVTGFDPKGVVGRLTAPVAG
ncbi:ACP S-malonyltransferase [Amycolatopsis sp. NPDC057786]|uniref:ACP S-malonyltransferase n=1 Tax=Amycolatopsis sp. NPDC057786 TaxID=3346250 RepID=UPI003671B515